jgi:hypothetical protein
MVPYGPVPQLSGIVLYKPDFLNYHHLPVYQGHQIRYSMEVQAPTPSLPSATVQPKKKNVEDSPCEVAMMAERLLGCVERSN